MIAIRPRSPASVLLGLGVLASCTRAPATHLAAVEPPPVGVMQATSLLATATPRTDPEGDLEASILDPCAIDVNNVDTAPEFDLGSSELRPSERIFLKELASCFTTGSFKGRSLSLIGHTDSRGDTEFNFVLGRSRAASVRAYLTSLGVDSSKIATISRGKLDAVGTDELGQDRDRRVDIELK
jgi:peptidoglycan-associated lipoprotein